MTSLSATRRRLLLLLPFLAALAILCWTPGASAHPGHHHPAERAASVRSNASAPQPSLYSAGTQRADTACYCCTAECQIQCAASVAAPVAGDPALFHGRHRIETVQPAPELCWQAPADQDPPRPSA